MKKVCTICNVEKDESEFYVKSDTGRPKSHCKGCMSQRDKERRKEHIKISKEGREKFIEDLMKQGTLTRCAKCGEEKLADQFCIRNRRGSLRLNSSCCKECDRWRSIKKNFNLSKSEYTKILHKQGHSCAICGIEIDEYVEIDPRKRKWFAVDHDHETEEIRGLLCDPCNRGLGAFRDSKQSLQRAIKYLEGAK